jgi:hypothetical protein
MRCFFNRGSSQRSWMIAVHFSIVGYSAFDSDCAPEKPIIFLPACIFHIIRTKNSQVYFELRHEMAIKDLRVACRRAGTLGCRDFSTAELSPNNANEVNFVPG